MDGFTVYGLLIIGKHEHVYLPAGEIEKRVKLPCINTIV